MYCVRCKSDSEGLVARPHRDRGLPARAGDAVHLVRSATQNCVAALFWKRSQHSASYFQAGSLVSEEQTDFRELHRVSEAFAVCNRSKHEVEMNINVLLLVAFMVTCIHFLKNLLLWVFTNLL